MNFRMFIFLYLVNMYYSNYNQKLIQTRKSQVSLETFEKYY